jgi:hypothetical protein
VNGLPVFGTIPRADLTIEGNKVRVSTTHLGIYQAAIVDIPSAVPTQTVAAGPIRTKVESAALPISVAQLSAVAFAAGTSVAVTGSNFRASVDITIGGVKANSVSVENAERLTFVVPEGISAGSVTVAFNQDGVVANMQGYVTDGTSEIPTISDDPTKRFVADSDRTKWDTAVDWGDHRTAGYIKAAGPGLLASVSLLSHNGIDSDAKQTSVTIVAPDGMTANKNYVLPRHPAATGKYLTADTDGIMTWEDLPSAGSLSAPGPIGAITPDSATFTTVSVQSGVTLDGAAARSIALARNTVAGIGGSDLVLSAGGVRASDSNGAGGNLVLESGTASGSGSSRIDLKTAGGGGSGSTDRSPTIKMTILGTGQVGIGTTTPGQTLTVDGTLGIQEGAGATFHTVFQGGDQSADVTYTLPQAAPTTNGQVLAATTSGVMSWSSIAAGTVTNVTTSSPLTVSNGTSTPALGITQAGTGSDGYLSQTDWNTFNNKVPSSLVVSAGTGLTGGGDLSTNRVISISTVPVSNGGTGATSFANAFGTSYYDGAKLATVSPGSSGLILQSTGPSSPPGFATLNLASSPALSGVLPVALGGTGLTSGTSGGVPYYSSGSNMASSAVLQAGRIVLGGGAGQPPATSTDFFWDTTKSVLSLRGPGGVGGGNTFVGEASGDSWTSGGVDNTYLGYYAGNAVTNASSNTIIGSQAGTGLTTGGDNTLVGSGAMTASSTTYSGAAFGSNASAGSMAVALGASAIAGDNEVVITAGSATRLKIVAGGKTKIGGFTPPTQMLDVGGAITSDLVAVTSVASPSFNASLGNTFKLTLTINASTSALSAASQGQTLTFIICQDGTGSRTFTWPTNVKGGMTISTAPSTCNAQTFIFDGTNAYATSPGKTGM